MNKVTLVGCGGWGKNIARNLAQMDALESVVDPSPAAAEIARDLGVECHNSVEAVLSRPTCFAVAIATPAATHFAMAMAAVRAGKHVYIEKPIALSVREGREIAAAADEANLVVMVGHLLQYHPAFRTLSDMVAEGRLGNVRHIVSSRLNLGMLRHEENVMWSFSPHDISMVLDLAKSKPEKVLACGSDFFQGGIVDVSTLQLRFEDGLTAEIRASWFNPEKEQKLTVIGDHALAVFNDTSAWEGKLQITDFEVMWQGPSPKVIRGKTQHVEIPKGEPLTAELQHFLDCIISGATPRTDANEAIGVLSLLQAAQASLDQGGIWQNV